MVESEYYHHSGKFGATGALISLLVGLVFAYLLGWVYVYITDALGFFAVVATIMYGVIVGAVVGAGLNVAKTRNLTLATTLGAIVGVAALYIDWAIWAHMLLARVGETASAFELLRSPASIWEGMVVVSQRGAWSYRGIHPTGMVLWAIWGIEAALIVGGCAWTTYSLNSEDPFCESCNEWTKGEKDVCWTALLDPPAMERVFQGRDWDELGKHPRVLDAPELRISLHVCPKCKAFQTLSAERYEYKLNQQGKRDEKTKTLIQHLLISVSDAQHIRKVGDKLDALDDNEEDEHPEH